MITLRVIYPQIDDDEIPTQEVDFSDDEIQAYGFDGQKYYIEVIDPLYSDVKHIEISQSSYMNLVDYMEEKHK